MSQGLELDMMNLGLNSCVVINLIGHPGASHYLSLAYWLSLSNQVSLGKSHIIQNFSFPFSSVSLASHNYGSCKYCNLGIPVFKSKHVETFIFLNITIVI